MLTVYGIRQCDTCRKALKWLTARGIEHRFHDFRADGLEAQVLQGWLNTRFADKVINRRSTTWRKLSDEQRQYGGEKQLQLLLQQPTLLKRPVFVDGDIIAIGFNPQDPKI